MVNSTVRLGVIWLYLMITVKYSEKMVTHGAYSLEDDMAIDIYGEEMTVLKQK